MPNLWIFGDSFSAKADNAKAECWPSLLANKLGVSTYSEIALAGVSNDWIFYMLTSNFNKMSSGDWVVVQTTQMHRQWFFEDLPDIANYWIKDFEKYVSTDRAKAVNMYVEHLQQDRIDHVRWVQFSLALERLTQLVDVNMLILPGFNPVNGVSGTLDDVSAGEFVDRNFRQTYFDNNNGKDPRHNHLSPENHRVLADKVFNFFKKHELVDLKSGFKTKFL